MNEIFVSVILPSIFGSLGAAGIAIMYDAEWKRFGYSALAAFISTAIFEVFDLYFKIESHKLFVASLAAAIVLAVYSDVMAHVLKMPATALLIPGVLPLVPGRSLYYATLSAINSSPEALTYAGEAIYIALGVAVGIVFVTFVMRRIIFIKRK